MWKHELGVKLLTRGRERTCLDVTRGRDRPCLGTHDAHSVNQANTMPPNSCTVSVKGARCPYYPPGRDRALWPADDARVWRQWQMGPQHGAVPIVIYATTWSRPHRHLQDQRDPRKEAKDNATPEALFLEGPPPTLSDPKGAGSISPDPGARAPSHPNPGARAPSRLTPRAWIRSRVGAQASRGPHCLQPLQMWKHELGVKLLTPGREQACLDVTRGCDRPCLDVTRCCDRPCLGTHDAHSVRQADTMPPNSYTVPVKGARCPYYLPGRDRVTPVCGASGKWGHDVEPSPSSSTGPVGPTQEGKGWCNPRSPFSSRGPASFDPKGAGSISPDHGGTGSVSSDPRGTGSISPDPRVAGSISLDPEGVDSVSGGRAGLMGARTVSNHYRCESMSSGSNFWHREGRGHASTWPVVATICAWGLKMPTTSGRLTLWHLTPVRFSSRAPVAHTTCQDGTGCHDRLMMPVCGASGKWGHDVEPSPSSSTPRCGAIPIVIYRIGGTHARSLMTMWPQKPFSSSFSLSHVAFTFPLTYKRGDRTPHRVGTGSNRIQPNSVRFFHQRLGTFSLSRPFITPTAN
jgi:hypothetical protein